MTDKDGGCDMPPGSGSMPPATTGGGILEAGMVKAVGGGDTPRSWTFLTKALVVVVVLVLVYIIATWYGVVPTPRGLWEKMTSEGPKKVEAAATGVAPV